MAESKIKITEDSYRRLFEVTEDMIFFTDANGTFRNVNKACVNLLGYSSKEELLSLSSIEMVYAKPLHWTVFKRQINKHGFIKEFEAQFKRKDGSILHCLLSGQAIKGSGNKLLGYQGMAKDITARMDAIRNFRQRHRELWVLNTVAFALNRSQDIDHVLRIALEKILYVLNLPSGAIYLIDQSKSEFVLRAAHGFPEHPDNRQFSFTLCDKMLFAALLDNRTTLTPEPIFPPFQALIQNIGTGFRQDLTCFLITAKDKASGFIALHVPPGRDIAAGYHLLGSLGNLLGGGIENKQLLQTVHQHREELKGLTAKLLHSQDMERQRIARELHDEAGQTLTGIHFTLETLEKQLSGASDSIKNLVADAKKQINRTYHEMRRLSHRLHPALLTDLGLEPAVTAYLNGIAENRPIKIDFKMIGFEKRVSQEIESALYRMTQEVLTNTLKHAGASRFKLSIIKGYPNIIFVAEDNGSGFDSDNHNLEKPALGLLSMRERAAMLGGRFSLRSKVGEGTRIRIEIPVGEDE